MSERSPAEWTAGAVLWDRASDLEQAIAAADAVLYAAKRRDRGDAATVVIPEQQSSKSAETSDPTASA